MDDLFKRLGDVEKAIVELRTRLDTALPHLATKADLHSAVHSTETRLGAVEARLGRALHSMEVRMITWMIATSISAAASAFAIAKYINGRGGAGAAPEVTAAPNRRFASPS